MSEPVGPSSPLPPAQSPNLPELAHQLQTQTIALADELQKILNDPTLTTQSDFLQQIATTTTQLNQSVTHAP